MGICGAQSLNYLTQGRMGSAHEWPKLQKYSCFFKSGVLINAFWGDVCFMSDWKLHSQSMRFYIQRSLDISLTEGRLSFNFSLLLSRS